MLHRQDVFWQFGQVTKERALSRYFRILLRLLRYAYPRFDEESNHKRIGCLVCSWRASADTYLAIQRMRNCWKPGLCRWFRMGFVDHRRGHPRFIHLFLLALSKRPVIRTTSTYLSSKPSQEYPLNLSSQGPD